jgi:hypothetical protein
MKRFVLFVVLFGCLCQGYTQEQQPVPAVNGYVTRAASPTDFDVNGFGVICTPKTKFFSGGLLAHAPFNWTETPYLGMTVAVFGKANPKKRTVAAEQVILLNIAGQAKVKGFGLIDRVWTSAAGTPGSILVRVDGYAVLIDAKTASTFTPPLSSAADIMTNTWLAFSGERRRDGVVAAETAAFTNNQISKGEAKFRGRSEYDPAAVDPNSKQNLLREAFLGFDPKKAAPYINPSMQERVDRIGTSLVPVYQRELDNSDPTKVNIRFQLIDERHFNDALSLPSGIILVPYQVVERMEDDSQLAAVLADNIATAIDKQRLRALPGDYAIVATELALYAVPFGVAGPLELPPQVSV